MEFLCTSANDCDCPLIFSHHHDTTIPSALIVIIKKSRNLFWFDAECKLYCIAKICCHCQVKNENGKKNNGLKQVTQLNVIITTSQQQNWNYNIWSTLPANESHCCLWIELTIFYARAHHHQQSSLSFNSSYLTIKCVYGR